MGRNLAVIATKEMLEAFTPSEMADALHPSQFGMNFHADPALDAVEAALLWAAGRISRQDFLATLDDLQ
jgi:hypothetical protein